jgi:hypothetical protein
MAITVQTTYSTNTISPDTNGAGGNGVAGSPGTRNPASLQAIFPGSPLVGYSEAKTEAGGESGELDYSDPAKLKAWFISKAVWMHLLSQKLRRLLLKSSVLRAQLSQVTILLLDQT